MDYLFNKLTECIKSSNKVVIMTHKHPDLDGMGSSICLQNIIKTLKKESVIVFPEEKLNKSLNKGLNILKENNINIDFIKEKALEVKKEGNLLIILDTHKKELVESEKLLNIKNIIVIDHHQISGEPIKNTIIEYIDSNKSSMVEIIVEYMKYLNIKMHPMILTILLTGLEIDTRFYQIKVTDKTFICAAYLLKNGADNNLKNEILKISKEEMIKTQEYIKKSYFIKEGYALCDMGNINDIVELSSLANELIQIEKVKASFAVGKTEDNIVHVSARSIEKINVEEIMNKIGGGGHKNDAAASFKNKTNKEVIKTIEKIVVEG